MRIAMVTAAVSRTGAGVAGAVEGLSASLHALGHEVRVFALADRAWREDGAAWRGAPVTQLAVQGPAALGYAPGMLPALLDFEPDIAHLHGLWMHPSRSVAQWSHKTGLPYILSPHGMLAPAALAFSPQKKRLSRILYQDRCFRCASAFHATSQAEADDIRQFGLVQPIDIVPHGIELRDRPAGIQRRKTILSLGRLHPVKGLDLLIRAWARLEPTYPDWDLRIVGPDQDGYAAHLKSLAEAQGLRRCRIEGPVYQDAKFRLLAEASVFVLPSQSENFGLTVVESLLMGTPVIASQGTPWADLAKRGCGDWVPRDDRAFAQAIEKLLRMTEAERCAMGETGRLWVQEAFSWPAVARQAEESYKRQACK